MISPAQLLTEEFLEGLSDRERLVLPYMPEVWLRPDQCLPRHDWRTCGIIAGRGWGKTYVFGTDINRRVEAGALRDIALMAPNEERAEEVQIAGLIETAPPWFKPIRYRGGLLWPNGAHATVYTPLAPGRPRSSNHDSAWCCELVDWPYNTRKEAFDTLASTVRKPGSPQQIYYDTTSKGKNDVILDRLKDHERDPHNHVLIRGTTFDNPLLSIKYLRAMLTLYPRGSRAFEEEIEGKVFAESAGALWKQEWLDVHRVQSRPADLVRRVIGVDPALSAHADADEFGIVHSGEDSRGHVHCLDDYSGKYTPEQWGDIIVRECRNGAAGAIVERNHTGDNPTYVIRSRAENHKLTVRVLEKTQPFPRYTPGVIYVREVVATSVKIARAGGPSAETEAGRVHMVGLHPKLELELTTYDGTGRSPNRYDAFCMTVTELRELWREAPSANPVLETADAMLAYKELQKRLRTVGRRGVGL